MLIWNQNTFKNTFQPMETLFFGSQDFSLFSINFSSVWLLYMNSCWMQILKHSGPLFPSLFVLLLLFFFVLTIAAICLLSQINVNFLFALPNDACRSLSVDFIILLSKFSVYLPNPQCWRYFIAAGIQIQTRARTVWADSLKSPSKL